MAGPTGRGTSSTSGRTFVDTNVLLYAYDRSAGEKHRIAREHVRELWESRDGVISTQVLQELYVNVTRKVPTPLTPARARDLLRDYGAWRVEGVHVETVLRASEIHERHRLAFWDSLVVATAAQAGAHTLLTEDLNPGQRIEGVRVVSPFA